MPYNFLNGGASGYPGVTVADGNAILTQMATLLSGLGWTIGDSIASSRFFTAQGLTTNGHSCFSRISNDTTLKKINVQGSLNNAYTTLSSVFSVAYHPTLSSRLYMGAKEDFFAFSVYNVNASTPTGEGAFFGFLDRKNTNDQFGVIVGLTDINFSHRWEIMRDYFTATTNWYQIYTGFSGTVALTNLFTASGSSTIIPFHALDPIYDNFYSFTTPPFSSTTTTNVSYGAIYGGRNPVNDSVEIDVVKIIEGRTTQTSIYGNTATITKEGKIQQINTPNYRGDLPDLIVRGMSGEFAGYRAYDLSGVDTRQFVSTSIGHLGIRIF